MAKIYVGNAKTRTSQYGEFLTWSVKLEELEKYVNEKGYVSIVLNKLKEPDKFGNDYSIAINEFKPEVKKEEEISVEDIPFR